MRSGTISGGAEREKWLDLERAGDVKGMATGSAVMVFGELRGVQLGKWLTPPPAPSSFGEVGEKQLAQRGVATQESAEHPA